jgi:hypothetical protein
MTNTNENKTFSILGIVFGGVALIFLPIILGPVGIILSVVGKTKGEKLANIALTVSILGTLVGMFIGAVVGALFFGI